MLPWVPTIPFLSTSPLPRPVQSPTHRSTQQQTLGPRRLWFFRKLSLKHTFLCLKGSAYSWHISRQGAQRLLQSIYLYSFGISWDSPSPAASPTLRQWFPSQHVRRCVMPPAPQGLNYRKWTAGEKELYQKNTTKTIFFSLMKTDLILKRELRAQVTSLPPALLSSSSPSSPPPSFLTPTCGLRAQKGSLI